MSHLLLQKSLTKELFVYFPSLGVSVSSGSLGLTGAEYKSRNLDSIRVK